MFSLGLLLLLLASARYYMYTIQPSYAVAESAVKAKTLASGQTYIESLL